MEEAKSAFMAHLNNIPQITDITGVTNVWGSPFYMPQTHVVYAFEKEAYLIVLKRKGPFSFEITRISPLRSTKKY